MVEELSDGQIPFSYFPKHFSLLYTILHIDLRINIIVWYTGGNFISNAGRAPLPNPVQATTRDDQLQCSSEDDLPPWQRPDGLLSSVRVP